MSDKFNVNETLRHLSQYNLTGKKNDTLNENAGKWQLFYMNHLDYLIGIVVNLFKWNGLPETGGYKLRSSFFEEMLSLNGIACFCDSKTYGLIASPCTVIGGLNPYGEPTKIKLSPSFDSDRFFNLNEEKENTKNSRTFVFCRNDARGTSFLPLIIQTAEMLTDILMSIRTNANQQKFPTIFKGKFNQKLSMEIVTNKAEGWDNIICLYDDNDSFNTRDIDVFNRNIPFVCDKLYQTYTDVLNNFFLRIGINNIPNAKKERMLVDEVNANNQAVLTSGDNYLETRLEICEQVNDVFGLNLSVKRNSEFIDSLLKERGDEPLADIRQNLDS